MKKLFLALMVVCAGSLPAHAQEEAWTEVGGYLWAASMKGDTQIRNVSADIDVSFSDILENLDMGGMAYAEHRRGKWSFIGDGLYMKLSASDTLASNGILTVTLDAEVKQIMAEGFVAYRGFEENYGASRFGIDLLGGARYNSLEVDVGVQAGLLGLTTQASRNRREEWTDGVVGLRAQYDHNNGWGTTVWADIGEGPDSHSYQVAGLVGYKFENNVKLFGGYRLYHAEYDQGTGVSRFGIDTDSSGPMLGVSYRF